MEEDLAELRDLLDRAGLRHVVCASGPGGGRHVWVALAAPVPAPVVAVLARSLASRLASLDIAPLTNPRTGCLRPPGAPHRRGGRSRLLVGNARDLLSPAAGPAQVHALLSLLGPSPTPERGDVHRAVARDTDGHSHLPGERRPLPMTAQSALDSALPANADASAVLWTVLLGAARARWRLADVAALLNTAPGLEHVRSARQGRLRPVRDRRAQAQVLTRQWERAVAYVSTSGTGTGEDITFDPRCAGVVAAIADVQSRADAAPGRWARPGGPSDRRVLDAACQQMLAAVRLDVELDIRRLGNLCGVSRETARRALQRLGAEGWLFPTAPAEGPCAARWGLHEKDTRLSTGDVSTGVSQADPRPEGARVRRAAWSHALDRRLAALAHDVFTPRPGLGHHAARTYAALSGQARGCRELLEVLGYSLARLDRYLDRLADHGLARLDPDGRWRRGRGSPAAAARRLGADGTLARRRRRHALEREAWAWWLDELAWMHLPRAAKRRRHDPPSGQVTLPLAMLTARSRLGAHPRGSDGRADYAAAAARLQPPGRSARDAA